MALVTYLLLLVEGCQIRHQEPDVSAIREGGIVIQCLGFLAGATSEQAFLEIIDARNVFLLADGHAGCTIEKIEWVCKTDMAQTQSVHNTVQALGIPVCYLIGHTKQIIVAAAIADYSDLSASWVDLGNSCTERVQMFEGQALANVWVRSQDFIFTVWTFERVCGDHQVDLLVVRDEILQGLEESGLVYILVAVVGPADAI